MVTSSSAQRRSLLGAHAGRVGGLARARSGKLQARSKYSKKLASDWPELCRQSMVPALRIRRCAQPLATLAAGPLVTVILITVDTTRHALFQKALLG